MTAATAVLFILYVTAVCMFAPHPFWAIPLLFLGWLVLDGVVYRRNTSARLFSDAPASLAARAGCSRRPRAVRAP
jgi:hypothetical protein